jgi:GntR family transcriptional regulator
VLPFPVALKPGESPYRQVVFAATKAVVAGILSPGDRFPSVRELSLELRINPNTAHKVVQELVRHGVLEVLPGVGTVVAARREGLTSELGAQLSTNVDQLVVEARRLGFSREDLLEAIGEHWDALSTPRPPLDVDASRSVDSISKE